jgi:hypothetical protein
MGSAEAMTSAAEVAAAARAAGVYLETVEGDDGLELVVVEAHGGPWLVYLDPDSILGWVAYQAEADGGGWWTIPETGGMLGAGDLEPDRIIANLLEASELPTDLYHRQSFVSTARRPSPTRAAAPEPERRR